MNWRPARRSSYAHLVAMLRTDEWGHVALTSRLKNAGKPFLGILADGHLWLLEDDGAIHGCLYFSNQGAVFPVFNPEELGAQERNTLRRIIFPRRHKIYSIQGMNPRVHCIEQLLDSVPFRVKNYRMLTYISPENSVKTPAFPVTVRPADAKDKDSLWPLEKGYLLEEVINKGDHLNENLAQRMFLHTLQTQLVYCAIAQNLPVAKAGTNARGWDYDQIGGVFVVPQYRNQGLGHLVMDELLSTIEQMQRHACLFVNTSNEPALHLYTSMGFVDRGGFRISYWRD